MAIEPTTTRLRAIWAEVLNVPAIRDEDHFLELGGDSIAAVLCAARIEEEFNVEVPVAMLFIEETTLGSLAEAIHATAQGESTPDVASV